MHKSEGEGGGGRNQFFGNTDLVKNWKLRITPYLVSWRIWLHDAKDPQQSLTYWTQTCRLVLHVIVCTWKGHVVLYERMYRHTKPLFYVHYLSFTYSVSVWLERLWSRLLNYELYNNLCKKHNPSPVVDLQVHGLRAHESGGWVPIPDSSLTLTSFFLLHEKHFSKCAGADLKTECKVTVWEGNPATVTGLCAPGPCSTGFGSCLSEMSQNSQWIRHFCGCGFGWDVTARDFRSC